MERSSRLGHAPRRVFAALATTILVLGAVGVTLARAATPSQTYTGCLELGLVFNVAIGTNPALRCPSGATKITCRTRRAPRARTERTGRTARRARTGPMGSLPIRCGSASGTRGHNRTSSIRSRASRERPGTPRWPDRTVRRGHPLPGSIKPGTSCGRGGASSNRGRLVLCSSSQRRPPELRLERRQSLQRRRLARRQPERRKLSFADLQQGQTSKNTNLNSADLKGAT